MAMAAANDVPIAQLITNDALIQPAHSTLLAGLDYRNVSLLETAFGLYNVSLNQANNPEIDLDPAQRPSHFAQLVGEFLWITAMNQPSLSDDIGALTAGIYILNDIESPSFETTYGPVAEGFWDAFHGETSTHYRWMYDQNRIRQRPNLLLYTQWFGLNSLEASYVQTVSAMRLRNDIYFSLEDSFFVLARLEEKFEDEDARDVNVDADIPAAGAWFLHAGRVIFQACQQGCVAGIFILCLRPWPRHES